MRRAERRRLERRCTNTYTHNGPTRFKSWFGNFLSTWRASFGIRRTPRTTAAARVRDHVVSLERRPSDRSSRRAPAPAAAPPQPKRAARAPADELRRQQAAGAGWPRVHARAEAGRSVDQARVGVGQANRGTYPRSDEQGNRSLDKAWAAQAAGAGRADSAPQHDTAHRRSPAAPAPPGAGPTVCPSRPSPRERRGRRPATRRSGPPTGTEHPRHGRPGGGRARRDRPVGQRPRAPRRCFPAAAPVAPARHKPARRPVHNGRA